MNTPTLIDRGVHTPRGKQAWFTCREGTNDGDVAVALNVWFDTYSDEYRMRPRHLSGWAIDVGAHIGGWSIPTAMDNPDLQILAIEVVPESADLVRENAKRNGVADRVHVITAAAAKPGVPMVRCRWGYTGGYTGDKDASNGYVAAHRYVAETWAGRAEPEHDADVPGLSLDDLLTEYGIEDVAFMKIDCEGCEWTFLDTPAVAKVAIVVGEHHGGLTGVEDTHGRLTELLGATHDIAWWKDEPVIGLFEAVRR